MEAASCSRSVLVDSNGRSTVFRPLSLSLPHTRSFHLSWISLFSCFFSTFSIPPLIPVIRSDLGLTESAIGAAGIASFAGSVISRLAMGPACDIYGPRIASAALSLLTVPATASAAFISSATSLFLVRFFIGFSLANFVANQYWMSSMFASDVVGFANGLSAGWANVGSGVAQLVMPLLYTSLAKHIPRAAWRVVFVVPTVFQTVTALLVLIYGQDPPRKDPENQNSEDTPEEKFLEVLYNGLSDYRGWILAILYGYSFGVEMTTENIIAAYFYDRFHVNLRLAGTLAAGFGMSNVISRPLGGTVSDKLGKTFGMRGRLWGLWAVQTLAGLLCVLLGRVNSVFGSFGVMSAFSFSVQAASGLTWGVVPFVSRRSMGVISGMTGSGGTVGAVVTQLVLFSGNGLPKQTNISLMGVLTVICTLPATLIYFPQWGGMFCGPSSTTVPAATPPRRSGDLDEEIGRLE